MWGNHTAELQVEVEQLAQLMACKGSFSESELLFQLDGGAGLGREFSTEENDQHVVMHSSAGTNKEKPICD